MRLNTFLSRLSKSFGIRGTALEWFAPICQIGFSEFQLMATVPTLSSESKVFHKAPV